MGGPDDYLGLNSQSQALADSALNGRGHANCNSILNRAAKWKLHLLSCPEPSLPLAQSKAGVEALYVSFFTSLACTGMPDAQQCCCLLVMVPSSDATQEQHCPSACPSLSSASHRRALLISCRALCQPSHAVLSRTWLP